MPRASNYQLINSPSSPPFPLSFSPTSFHRLLSSILHLSSRPYLFSLSLSRQDPLLYTSLIHTYIHWQGLGRRGIEKERSDRAFSRDNPCEIIYRIERRPTLLPLVSIIVSRRFIDAPRKRLLPESRLLTIRSLKATSTNTGW